MLPAATAARAAAQGGAGEDGPGGEARIVSFEQQHYAVGSRHASGYREFSTRRGGAANGQHGGQNASSCYEHHLAALVFVPLARVGAEAAGHGSRPAALAWPTCPPPAGGRPPLDLASFTVAGQWYGLPCEVVVEAVVAHRITPLARGDARLLGTVLHDGVAIAIFDLAVLLNGTASNQASPTAGHTVIVLRGGDGQPAFGLRVETLGEHLQVPLERLERLERLYPQGAAWVESLVRAPLGAQNGAMLMVLSAARLADELSGGPVLAAA